MHCHCTVELADRFLSTCTRAESVTTCAADLALHVVSRSIICSGGKSRHFGATFNSVRSLLLGAVHGDARLVLTSAVCMRMWVIVVYASLVTLMSARSFATPADPPIHTTPSSTQDCGQQPSATLDARTTVCGARKPHHDEYVRARMTISCMHAIMYILATV